MKYEMFKQTKTIQWNRKIEGLSFLLHIHLYEYTIYSFEMNFNNGSFNSINVYVAHRTGTMNRTTTKPHTWKELGFIVSLEQQKKGTTATSTKEICTWSRVHDKKNTSFVHYGIRFPDRIDPAIVRWQKLKYIAHPNIIENKFTLSDNRTNSFFFRALFLSFSHFSYRINTDSGIYL